MNLKVQALLRSRWCHNQHQEDKAGHSALLPVMSVTPASHHVWDDDIFTGGENKARSTEPGPCVGPRGVLHALWPVLNVTKAPSGEGGQLLGPCVKVGVTVGREGPLGGDCSVQSWGSRPCPLSPILGSCFNIGGHSQGPGSGVPTRHGHSRVPRTQGPHQVYLEKQGFAIVPGTEKQE